MALRRIDNVGIVVDDLDAAIEFFKELGMELEGRTTVEGDSVDRLVALQNVRSDVAMMRTATGQGVELSKFHSPVSIRSDPSPPPVNVLGMGRIMFAVDNIDDTVARLRARGVELVGDTVEYEDAYRLCYLRGPEGIMVALAQQLS